MKLSCLIVGTGRTHSIDVSDVERPSDLKKKIETQCRLDCPVEDITLYYARRGGEPTGKWLPSSHGDFHKLSRGDADVVARYLRPEMRLKTTWNMQQSFTKVNSWTIQVLVKTKDANAVIDIHDAVAPLQQPIAAVEREPPRRPASEREPLIPPPPEEVPPPQQALATMPTLSRGE